ncbi:hypothetical protein KCU65_g50, partial [Aureobasidium melanogenum]
MFRFGSRHGRRMTPFWRYSYTCRCSATRDALQAPEKNFSAQETDCTQQKARRECSHNQWPFCKPGILCPRRAFCTRLNIDPVKKRNGLKLENDIRRGVCFDICSSAGIHLSCQFVLVFRQIDRSQYKCGGRNRIV